jgi:hypothetical protein
MSALPSTSTRMARVEAPTPHQSAGEAGTTEHHSLGLDVATAVSLALARAGLSHKEACFLMGVDASNWSKQLRGDGHVSLQRLAQLPPKFWREFVPLLAEAVQLTVSHPDFETVAMRRVVELVAAIGQVFEQSRARRIA